MSRPGGSARHRPSLPWLALLPGVLVGLLLQPSLAPAEDARRQFEPWIGYAYPAGAQRAKTVRVDVGGQVLRGVTGVRVSGSGVHARLSLYLPPWQPLDGEQAAELRRQLAAIREQRLSNTTGEGRSGAAPAPAPAAPPSSAKAAGGKPADAPKPVLLPDHPLLKALEGKSQAELQEVEAYFFGPRPRQDVTRALAETARLEVTVDADASPGVRDLRLVTPQGVTNPLPFHVGLLPEVLEAEPNHQPPERATAPLPVVFNGQVKERDVDCFRFAAAKGQSLVIRTEARRLVPYLADAVPGWMQAVVTLRDAAGREVAFADDYLFEPDPVLLFRVPADGEYVLEIRDAIFRGRDDFVYRITVGELPFATSLFPLGAPPGGSVTAELGGWNLPTARLPLNTGGRPQEVQTLPWMEEDRRIGDLSYAVDAWPSRLEGEPNGEVATAEPLDLPVVVDGRILEPGDADCFRFEGRKGQELVVAVEARALGSPLDSLVRLLGPGGEVVAWNDDQPDAALGLLTHQADSYLLATLPANGTYVARLTDAQGHGSAAHAYRLRLGPPRPDFTLLVTPSTMNAPAGRSTLIEAHLVRRDGFAGDVELVLEEAPPGFELSGARIPAGQSKVALTLKAPREGPAGPFALRFKGRAKVGRETLERIAIPADDVMQAFLWRHLVPAHELLGTIMGEGRGVPQILAPEGPPRVLRAGARETVELRIDGVLPVQDLRFELRGAPEGVTLTSAKATPTRIRLEVAVDRGADLAGQAGNLIVEVLLEQAAGEARRGRLRARQRWLIGVLPAIPYEIR